MSIKVPEFDIQAINDDEASDNRIHSDEIAKKFGFTGALVTGVSVFGYLSQPLVQAYGEEWLSSSKVQVKFIKPAYHHDQLKIQTVTLDASSHQRHHRTTAMNQDGTVLAVMESWKSQQTPAGNEAGPHALASSNSQTTDDQNRQEIAWDLIHINAAAEAFSWQPAQQDNQRYLATQRDPWPHYHDSKNSILHPHYLLSQCNQALRRMFILPAWIHTGSELTMRSTLKVGQSIDVKTIPIEKWERKGHQFIKLYNAFSVNNELALEAEHTAIFKIAGNN